MKKRWFILPIIGVIALVLALSVITFPSRVIVEAQVSMTASYGTGFLAQVRTTHAFHGPYDEGGWFEVWSKCSLSINQVVDVNVEVTSTLFGDPQPTSIEAQLYKIGGPANIGYVPWDGC